MRARRRCCSGCSKLSRLASALQTASNRRRPTQLPAALILQCLSSGTKTVSCVVVDRRPVDRDRPRAVSDVANRCERLG